RHHAAGPKPRSVSANMPPIIGSASGGQRLFQLPLRRAASDVLGRKEHIGALADDLVAVVAEQPLGASGPRLNLSLTINDKNRVVLNIFGQQAIEFRFSDCWILRSLVSHV